MTWFLLFVCSICVLALLARWPVETSLGLYAFFVPFDSVLDAAQMEGRHIHLTWFIGAATGAVLLVIGLAAKRFERPPSASLWLGLFVFWAGISYFWSINAEIAIFRIPLFGGLLLLYLVAASLRISEKELNTVTWLAIIGASIAALLSLYAFGQGEGYSQLGGRGSLSVGERLANPNTLGASLILPLSLAIGGLLAARSGLQRLLTAVAVGLLIACIFTTMSRGSLLGVLGVLLVYLWHSRARRRLLIPATLMSAVIFVMPELFFSRLGETLADRGAGRLDIWRVGLEALKHYPILGAGIDCFPDAYDQYVYVTSYFKDFSRGAHSLYLGMWVELGTIGLILLIASIIGHLRSMKKAREADANEEHRLRLVSCGAGFFGLLVCGLFGDLMWEEYFWLAWMLVVLAPRVMRVREHPRAVAETP